MKFIFKNKEGKEEEIKLERWGWGVVYKNGGELHQFGKDGIFHQIGEVKQEDVSLFVLYKIDEPSKRIDIVVPNGSKLIHKYKQFILYFGRKEERKETVYVFGYKKDGQHSHFNFILPDDRVIQSDREDVELTNFNL